MQEKELLEERDRNWQMFDAIYGEHPMLADIREFEWYPPFPKRRPCMKNFVPWLIRTAIAGAILAAICFTIVIMRGG